MGPIAKRPIWANRRTYSSGDGTIRQALIAGQRLCDLGTKQIVWKGCSFSFWYDEWLGIKPIR